MIWISLCTVAQDWTAHLSNPLSVGGDRRDVGVGVRRVIRLVCLDEVDVQNACVFVFGVVYYIHSDNVHELLELPADEEVDAVFRVAPLMKSGGVSVWIVIFFIGAVFGGRVEQCLVKLQISSSDEEEVEVVISFDVSVHQVRLKVVFDLGILAVGCVHVS